MWLGVIKVQSRVSCCCCCLLWSTRLRWWHLSRTGFKFFLCLNFSRGLAGNFSFGARFLYILHSFFFLLACVECLRRKRKQGSFAQVESKQTALLRQLHLMRAVHLALCRQACKLVRLSVSPLKAFILKGVASEELTELHQISAFHLALCREIQCKLPRTERPRCAIATYTRCATNCTFDQ